MKTKEEFKRSKWHLVLVGLATLGRDLEAEDAPLKERARKYAAVGDEILRLMDEIYDYLNAEEKPKGATK